MTTETIVEAAHDAAVAAAETEVAVVAAEQASAAAETAALAAEEAIALTAVVAARAEIEAAEEVREVVETVEYTERNLSWLENELNQHRSADSSWKAAMEIQIAEMRASQLEMIEAIRLLTPSQALESSIPQTSEVVEAEVLETAQVNPGAVVVAQEAQAAEASPRKKARKLL